MIGGPVKPPPSRTALAHDLPSRLDATTLIYQDALVRVIAVTIDHFHYPRVSREARFPRSYAYRIDAGGSGSVFRGDTRPSQPLNALATRPDSLICKGTTLARGLTVVRDS